MKYVIDKNVDTEYIINKSKFIVCLIKLDNCNMILDALNDIKSKYKAATHYCYAYIIDSTEKCSDDKEPSGTAGLPILNVLKKNNLNKILCVVVRYFGGIKLGASGLLRAYSSCVSNTIKDINLIEDIEYNTLNIEFSYDNIKIVEHILKKYNVIIINKVFDNLINFEIKVQNNILDKLIFELKNIIKTDKI